MGDPVGLTLSRFIHLRQREHPAARGELSDLLETIGLAGRVIAAAVRRAGLGDVLGLAGRDNVQEEHVKKVDVIANEALIAALGDGGRTCVIASEEEEAAVPVTNSPGDYAVAFDPLDGSGNIDTNMPMGTIFSVYRRISPAGAPGNERDLLRKGSEQVVAGYVLYGSSTMLVYACDDGVHGFTLDPLVGTWLSTHPDLSVPSRGKTWLGNAGNRAWWHPGVQAYVSGLESLDAAKGRPYGQRYSGALVADVHRILLEGGIFLYPADTRDPKKPHGKLRLLYECSPLAFVIEKAGGAATDGKRSILDVPIETLHQRSPLFIGSREDVAEATAAAQLPR